MCSSELRVLILDSSYWCSVMRKYEKKRIGSGPCSVRAKRAHSTCLPCSSQRKARRCASGLFHHVYPFTIRADPGGSVAHAPFVLLETCRADLKTAAAVPAEGFHLCAAVAAEFFFPSSATGRLIRLVFHYLFSSCSACSSCSIQARYFSAPAITGTARISGTA